MDQTQTCPSHPYLTIGSELIRDDGEPVCSACAADVETARYRAETARRAETYRRDTHALLGSAAYFLRSLADGRGELSPAILQNMARVWVAAYDRYGNGESAALDWTAR